LVSLPLAAIPDDRPEQASWLSVDEREWLARALAAERAQKGPLEHVGALHSLANPKVWLLCVIYFSTPP